MDIDTTWQEQECIQARLDKRNTLETLRRKQEIADLEKAKEAYFAKGGTIEVLPPCTMSDNIMEVIGNSGTKPYSKQDFARRLEERAAEKGKATTH